MNYRNNLLVFAWWLVLLPVISFSQLRSVDHIIPKPVSVLKGTRKTLHIDNRAVILAGSQFTSQAVYLKEQLQRQCGLVLAITEKKPDDQFGIILHYDTVTIEKPEMYRLSVADGNITIQARDVAGVVHGIQTLLQLMPLQPVATITLAPVLIEDYPRFAYRGMHLDVSRHFFPVDFIKKYIDFLTFHKFNTFHWHLTDDQGWRIEIKSYPKLTSVGAWRDSTLIGHFKDTPARYDGERYGGFYTQDEIRTVVEYAAVRGINIIPEIDIPGHSRAAIAAYPGLSTRPDTAWQVATTWGMYNRQNNVLAPNETTIEFLKAVFDEVAGLFPSPYIHIGGDECSTIWWKADPKTQAFMQAHGIAGEAALQTWFIQQVIAHLQQKGKKVIGWDEILEGEPDTSAIIMNWRGVKAAIHAAQKGHQVIMSPGKPLYFDNYQSKTKDSLAIHGYTPLDAVYKYEPVPKEVAEQGLSNRIIGAQGNVWTEYMQYPTKVEYMIFPRMTALSEALWTFPRNKNYKDFIRRIKENVIPRYQYWNSSYFKDFELWTSEK